MGEEGTVGNADFYMSDGGDAYSYINGMMRDIWSRQRRLALLNVKPEKLSAPVYEEIERELMGWDGQQPLARHIASLEKIAAKAPKGCKVVIEFERESHYDGGYDTYRRIGFYRPPTPEEIAERKARNAEIREVQAEAAANSERREREEYERLAAKYSPDRNPKGRPE